MQLKSKKRKQSDFFKKWEENVNRQFSKEDVQMADRYRKGCSASLTAKETQT